MGFFNDKDNPNMLSKRLYSYSGGYKYFKNIDKDIIKKVKKKIHILDFDKLRCYRDTLKYLTNPYIHLEFPTYDERIFFLIQSVDPNLYMYKEFISTEMISKSKIENTTDTEEKEFLESMRRNQLNDYMNKIRNKIGVFDTKLLSYEADLYKFLHKERLNSDIKINCIEKLFRNSKFINNFDNIDNDRFEKKLNAISKKWYEKASNPKDYNSLAYNILNKTNVLGLNSYEEQTLLFIIVADPELKLLDIYEEESKYDMIKKRKLRELGFYDKNLIQLEKKYHERFMPDKKIKSFNKK